MKFRKTKHNITIEEFFTLNFDSNNLWEYKADETDLLAELADLFRPKDPHRAETVSLESLLQLLRDNERYCTGLSLYLKGILKQKKFSRILTDAGILGEAVFFSEVRKRLFAKLIPDQPQKDTLEYVLNQVFYLKTDPIWVEKIPMEQLEEFYHLVKFRSLYVSSEQKSPLAELLYAMEVLIHRITGRALESEVIQMVPEYEGLESPFLAIQKEFALLSARLLEEQINYVPPDDIGYRQMLVLHHQCTDYVRAAFRNSEKYGISLRVNQSLLRIRQQLERLGVLLPLLAIEQDRETAQDTIRLGKSLITYNCDKNNVRKLINESTQLLSYEVTQHTANTGENYITKSRLEYLKMFWAASGGGIIVGILCIIKVFLSKMETSAFGHAFFYSLNYSFGFIAIYVLGFTLATKQPAMTAAALVRAIESGRKNTEVDDEEKHRAFAEFFARVFRSQFIAFLGNVLVAFPVSLLGIWLIDYAFSYNLTLTKWYAMMTDLSPIHSLAILHAAIAGVFLFLSGIIAGSVANRDKHRHVYYRIEEHPVLKRSFGRVRTQKLAKLYERKWAGVISNFWFGVFMGSTASIGVFLGLNLDVRHITFASGNLALALYGANWNVSNELLFWGIFGIGIIGLVNFMVSFSLSMGLAFRSRNIPLSELRPISKSIWKHFKRRPGSFFFPSLRKQY
ncbi:site-specific recombinase [Flavobacterium sp. MFBS3-15]|uniref:site-specific recombinase n=1 Tax=Flavobacterium sp. MFBS3-15 TaxID=2989816 RepID=UPI002235A506|nr:site-specific recombinase [Flavobacterium sp. MFBS3-15]MCW4470012.1 site-specific recombinase [Flavobacterium sp. MFBS3-15]